MKQTVINAIYQEKLIAILRGIPDEKLIPLANALYAGGIRLLEITFHPDGSIPDAHVIRQIQTLTHHFAGKVYIGAGTVLTAQQVIHVKTAGGSFIISPDSNRQVIEETTRQTLVSIPGALTPTEISTAHRWGADFVKLFPATAFGDSYIKAIRAPISHIPLLAVGGIDLANIPSYLRAGVCGFGIGSNLADKKMLAEENWDGITELTRQYTEVVRNG